MANVPVYVVVLKSADSAGNEILYCKNYNTYVYEFRVCVGSVITLYIKTYRKQMLSSLPQTSLESLQVRRKMDLIAKVFKSHGH